MPVLPELTKENVGLAPTLQSVPLNELVAEVLEAVDEELPDAPAPKRGRAVVPDAANVLPLAVGTDGRAELEELAAIRLFGRPDEVGESRDCELEELGATRLLDRLDELDGSRNWELEELAAIRLFGTPDEVGDEAGSKLDELEMTRTFCAVDEVVGDKTPEVDEPNTAALLSPLEVAPVADVLTA
jgi:hypothetical protein